MSIYSLYRDFFRFLDALERGEDACEAYNQYYFKPHKKFLNSYWRHFRYFDEKQIKERVRSIKSGDYSLLRDLLFHESPEDICLNTLRECQKTAGSFIREKNSPAFPEPDIYLFIGFFSADGFTLKLDDNQVIGFGLERYKSFRNLPLIFAHEFGHYLRLIEPGALGINKAYKRGTLGEYLFSEGMAFVFSLKVFPERKLFEHLFFSFEIMEWCKQNEKRLLEEIEPMLNESIEPNSIYFIEKKMQIPPRSLNFAAYKLAERAMKDSFQGLG